MCRSVDPHHQAAALRPSKSIVTFHPHPPFIIYSTENVTDVYGNGGGIDYYPTQITGLALFFGNAVFSFEGIGVVKNALLENYNYLH